MYRYRSVAPPDLHPFPTRRSSDLQISPEKMGKIKPSVVASPKGDVEKFARLLETLTAQTDCGACGYPTCYDYTKARSEEHTSELQSLTNLVCRLLLEKKKHK